MALTLKYDFATDKSLVADTGPTLSITRATDATYFDSAGVMQTASSGVARFDHNPSTLASLGLLVEEARTNICLQSEDFSAAGWTPQFATVDANAGAAPDGSITADRINVAASSNIHNVYRTITVVVSTNYCLSAYFKDDGAGYAGLCFGSGTNWVSATWNLSTAAIAQTAVGSSSGTLVSTGIEDAGNGWYRCWLVGSIAIVAGFPIPYTSDGGAIGTDGRRTYLGVEGDDLLVWGAQLEAGAFPTSYIPTTTASVTRNADVVSTTTLSWLDTAATAVGSWYVRGQFPYADTVARALLTLDDGTATDRFYFERDASENINFATTNSGDTDGASDGAAVIAVNTAFEVSAGYADDDVIAYVDGASSGADATAGIPLTDNPTTLRVGNKYL